MDVLVGRDRELATLDEVVRRAAAGEHAVVLVTGEPGIGKTRLLHELAQRMRGAGGVAAWGRSSELGLTPAFWPWTQLLSSLGNSDDPAPDLDQLDASANASARLSRFARVLAYVRRRSERAPIAILFDDVHAADLSSLELLELAVHQLTDARVAFGLAARDGDATTAVLAALGRVQRSARRLPLARLVRSDVEQFVGDRVAPSTKLRVWELSEGNPLFVEELVASVVSSGAVRLPEVSSVRAFIRERIERLGDEVARVLAAAAVVGREFRSAVVADILGVPDAQVSELLDAPLRLKMVDFVTADRYRFSHALVAEALVDELNPSEQARLHLRAAHALERRDGGDASAVAHHLLAAGHLAAEAAVTAAERAANEASARLAFEDAAALLERAVAALALAAPGDHRRRAGLLQRWAEALHHAGQHVRAAELCDAATEIARSLGDAQLGAQIALVRGLEQRFGRTDPRLVAALSAALERLPDDAVALRARVLARLAAAEQPAADPAGPIARAHDAIRLAADLEDEDRLDVLYTATAAIIDYGEPSELEALHADVLALATALDARQIVVHTLARRCLAALTLIDRTAFEGRREELRALAEAMALPRWLGTLALFDSASALLDGRFAASERAIERAQLLAGGDENAAWLLDVHRVTATWTRQAVPDHEAAERLVGPGVDRIEITAWIAFATENVAGARAAVTRMEPQFAGDFEGAVYGAPAIAAFGSPALIRATRQVLEGYRTRGVVISLVGSAIIDVLPRLLLLLASANNDHTAIDGLAAEAFAVTARLRSAVWTARVQVDYADALARRGGSGDAARAKELRASAGQTATQLGMTTLVARCTSAGTPVPSPPTRVAATVTSERSGELWIVRGFGEEHHVRDSRGMQMLARLFAAPGQDIHVLDLVQTSGGSDAVDSGDSGELLDATARANYRDRLRELTAARDEAEAWADHGRVERITVEIDALTDELERAVGLGGRARKSGSAVERARTNVQRRMQHAIAQIRAASPRIGEHLAATVRTGTYCCFAPA